MEQAYTSLKRFAAGTLIVAALATADQMPASAQETTTTQTLSSATATAPKVPRTTATPEMITDAIERSQSRTERARTLGIPEQFGSEDPARFTVKR